jgi:hypothetical protein
MPAQLRGVTHDSLDRLVDVAAWLLAGMTTGLVVLLLVGGHVHVAIAHVLTAWACFVMAATLALRHRPAHMPITDEVVWRGARAEYPLTHPMQVCQSEAGVWYLHNLATHEAMALEVGDVVLVQYPSGAGKHAPLEEEC